MGRLAEAREENARAVALARHYNDSETLQWAQGGETSLAFYSGEPGNAIVAAREGVEIAERQGAAFNRSAAQYVLAMGHLVREEYDEAAVAAGRSVELVEESGTGRQYDGWYRGGLSLAQTRGGHPGL